MAGKKILIVESPTKAKTISKYVDKDFVVESSYGHIRDLPKTKLGVDLDDSFKPQYVIPPDKRKVVNNLKKLVAGADEVIFATDADREGEAIAWHLYEVLNLNKNKKEIKRITFHEITKEAILEALKSSRDIDMKLVDAQQARRILDRLVGYNLSPFLWKKVAKGLSAGRVQSAALRLIVEKEEEIKKFKPEEYWSVDVLLSKDKESSEIKISILKEDEEKDKIKEKEGQFTAKLSKIKDKTLDKLGLKTREEVEKVVSEIKDNDFKIVKVDRKITQKSAPAPFITSTLQQAANQLLGFSAKQTMYIAQQLYEGVELGDMGQTGLITYMRTDSVNLSDKFISDAREYIKNNFGDKYLPEKAVKYKTKVKNAQEAHEAIRPTSVSLHPDEIKQYLNDKQYKLYKLIWQRAIASQMEKAQLNSVGVDIQAGEYTFRATGQTIKFDGFMKVYPVQSKEKILPDLKEGEKVYADTILAIQHFTKPPARYTEASLVKKLEELGIGRPSTYASIISTIQERGYVIKEGRNLKPTEMGEVVSKILVEHFPEIVDYKFTAKMEDELDMIAVGDKEWKGVIEEFYTPFSKHLKEKEESVSKKDLQEETDEVCEKCGSRMVIKFGRYGKFMACSNFPECKNTKQINNGEDEENQEDLGSCPECGKDLIRKRSRYGVFVACSGYPECKYIQNNSKSLDIKCPECGDGEIVAKTTRRKKVFYACSRYPDCRFAVWDKPIDKKCPKCSSILVEGKKAIKCSSKECDFVLTEEDKM